VFMSDFDSDPIVDFDSYQMGVFFGSFFFRVLHFRSWSSLINGYKFFCDACVHRVIFFFWG